MSNKTAGQAWYDGRRLDPRWQTVKARIILRAGSRCEDCGDNTTTLHVHHREYITGRDPWEYPDENFVCCCEPCHKKREEVVRQSRMVFQSINPETALQFLHILMTCGVSMDSMVGELCLYAALASDAAKKRGESNG